MALPPWQVLSDMVSPVRGLFYYGTYYLLDVLWGQLIKLVQVASTSESFPLISVGPQKSQKLTASKIKYEMFVAKNCNSLLKNGYLSAPLFQEIEFFEHIKCNFKTS